MINISKKSMARVGIMMLIIVGVVISLMFVNFSSAVVESVNENFYVGEKIKITLDNENPVKIISPSKTYIGNFSGDFMYRFNEIGEYKSADEERSSGILHTSCS